MRSALVVLHRWVGLATAAFLFVAGLTGAVIAFNHELDAWLNPDLFEASSAAPALSPLAVVERFEAAEPRAEVTYTPLAIEAGQSLAVNVEGRVDPRTGVPFALGYTEAFLNPVTGAVLGTREWGACCLGRKQVVPFLYVLHYTLHAPGVWGLWVMGIVALLWMGDCVVGFYLTLPVGAKRFWTAWKPAWQVTPFRRLYRLNFDLHRAAGLWFGVVLFVLAVTGAALNLRTEVAMPFLSLFTTVTPTPYDDAAPSKVPEAMSLTAIADVARSEAIRRGWQAPTGILFSRELGVYTVSFGDPHESGLGPRYVYFDAATGVVRSQWAPGEGTAGDRVLQAVFPLHSGQILGLPGRIVIALSGIAVSLLSATGVVIWAKKRRGRRALADRRLHGPRSESVRRRDRQFDDGGVAVGRRMT